MLTKMKVFHTENLKKNKKLSAIKLVQYTTLILTSEPAQKKASDCTLTSSSI